MIRRLLLTVLGCGVFVGLVSLGGGRGVVSIVFGWLVLGYLLRCAAPVIRSDVRFVRGLLPAFSRKGKYL